MTSKIEIRISGQCLKYRYVIERQEEIVFRENVSDQEIKKLVLKDIHESVDKTKVTLEREI